MAWARPGRWSLGLLLAEGARAFLPFAGVEEFKPQPLEQFCSSDSVPSEDGQRTLRRCHHSVRKTLDDGGELELSWAMHAEPDRILSLDTEGSKGVRLKACRPGELELELPATHAQHAAEGHIVMGSRFVHTCGHLGGRHLYHRVLGVRERRRRRGQGLGETVTLATEELPSFTHAFEFMSFNFSYMPVEASDYVPFPEMRTDFGQRHLNDAQKRRLLGFPKFPKTLKKMMHIHHVEDDNQEVQMEDDSQDSPFGETDSKSGLLHFSPKQVSNFGWNWNFFMNTTQQPSINIDMPGARGRFEVHKPFIKVHAGLFLNFTSKFEGIIKVPKVHWRAGMDGHGFVQARVLTMLNTTHSAGVDPFQAFNYPSLQALERPRWFQKIDIATGVVPISFEPGCQIKAQVYHAGTFHGAVSFGGKTHGRVRPTLTFDSLKGFDADFQGELLDSEVWPPLWMIFTKHFELGVTAVPSTLMRGDFLGFEKATTAIEMMPYINITVTRAGEHPVFKGEGHTLTAYPLRVMGLARGSFEKRYKVRVAANGVTADTKPVAHWGEVDFHEHVSDFDFGQVGLHVLKGKPVMVSLLEVKEINGEDMSTVLGVGSVHCRSVDAGECHPSPTIARIRDQDGNDIAAVQLILLWQDSPKLALAAKIKGLSLDLGQLAVRPGGLNTSEQLSVHLVQGGLTYAAVVHSDPSSDPPSLTCSTSFMFRPALVDSWKRCAPDEEDGPYCSSPKLELFAGQRRVAEADFPQQEWAQASAGTALPMAIPLAAVEQGEDSAATFIAVLRVNISVLSPAVASAFLLPHSALAVAAGESTSLAWTRKGAREGTHYEFHMMVFKLDEGASTFANLPSEGNACLAPVAASAQSASLACKHRAILGLSSEDAPCSFSHELDLGKLGLAVGDQVSVLLQWTEEGNSHVMYSPPLEITKKGSRRLQDAAQTTAGKTWTRERWNQKMSEHQKSCEKRDLHFALGAGILMRARIKHGGLLKGIPMVGGELETPELSTGYRKIAAIKPHTDARDLLPDALCADGLCSGALPGCSAGSEEKRFYPKLVFNMNRPYHFSNMTKGKFHGVMKRAMAYAFSAMPMMLNVAIKEFKETGGLFGTTTPAFSLSGDDLPFGGVLSGGRSTSKQPAMHVTSGSASASGSGSLAGWDTGGGGAGQAAGSPSTTSSAAEGNTDVFNQWYDRRLAAQVGLGGHQVELSFEGGLPFQVDKRLVDLMLKHGYFPEIEDDVSPTLGPLRVVGFSVEEEMAGAEERLPGPSKTLRGSARNQAALVLASPLTLGVLVSLLAFFGLGGVWLSRAKLLRRMPLQSVQLAGDVPPAE